MSAQTELELPKGRVRACPDCGGACDRSWVRVCPSYRGAELLEIVPVELALAVRSRPIGAHREDKLAEKGGKSGQVGGRD